MVSVPQADLWVQYSLIGILLLVVSAIAIAFYRLWRELLAWIELQDTKREAERERQRIWQEKQDSIRDERWHSFLSQMQEEWINQLGHHSASITALISKVDNLIQVVSNHDVWVRSKSDRE